MKTKPKRYEISDEQLNLLKAVADGVMPLTPNTNNWVEKQLLAIISSIRGSSPDAFVRAWLSDGPKQIGGLKALAAANGIIEADLMAAVKRHASRRKRGFGGKWYYVLREAEVSSGRRIGVLLS